MVKRTTNKMWPAVIIAVAVSVVTAERGAVADSSTKAFNDSMAPVLVHYLKVQKALALDSPKGVAPAAKSLLKMARRLNFKSVSGKQGQHLKSTSRRIRVAATRLAKAKNIVDMRTAFHALSKPMAAWATMFKPKGIQVMYCSMADGKWLQKSGAVRNPYFGARMLTCGKAVGGASKASGHDHGGGH